MPWPVFPKCPTFGFTKRADYSVTIVERSSGIRTVNRNWYYPLHTFSAVPMGDRYEDDIHLVMRFWHYVGGQSGQFLFRDLTDYASTALPSLAITPFDQPLIEIEGSPGGFQLTKVYVDDTFAFQQQRLIQKPEQGTLRLGLDGVEIDEGDDWTCDYDTGVVQILAGLGSPAVLTWGGEFYVPVMFESTPEFMISEEKIQQTSFALRELRLAA
jgi:uncharacterized protein (TIGR02217 family)